MFQQISVGSQVRVAELGMGQMQTAGEQSLAAEIIRQSVLGTPVISPSRSPVGSTRSRLTRVGFFTIGWTSPRNSE